MSELLTAPSPAELTTVAQAMGLACARLNAVGIPVHLLATGYLPAQGRWLGLLLADAHDVAHQAAANAQLTMFRVVEV